MAEPFLNTNTQRYAVVTGANKGIGFDICKQLASKGILVILTARDEKRGIKAQERLKEFGVSDKVIFHQLDVVDPASIASLVDFIKSKFGKLDILVNNAGVSGLIVEGDVLVLQELILESIVSISDGGESQRAQPKASGTVIETLKGANDCVQTNYFGVKGITEALIPLLQLSDSPRIVNVSSMLGNLKLLSNEWAKGILSNEESLSEDKIDEVVHNYLKNFEEGSLEANRWPTKLSAYKVSKAALNAYTRLTAKKHPNFRINCVCPGFARTEMTCNLGFSSADEAAGGPVKLALLPNGGPSGLFFKQNEVSPF
ncbi:(+)-neomenthol dehydrogenase [Phtheirospermum japonicum]|uniref:(+)-neomenthol dehydrogenase n=1 Tax=Phtheirospermum japonicum TaxID=374723 RepID=A0A830CCR6_9LAMI|nr:(+)-neomenthol dehydrogenase [Phtheirospermum japonicum]